MTDTRNVYAISASGLALCQRCPRLLAYRRHRNVNHAWKVGIRGSGEKYGSLFHRHIAQAFFEAASGGDSSLRRKIARALSAGREGRGALDSALENLIREAFFFPFLEKESSKCTSGKILAMAGGAALWSRCMADFFIGIPSLCAAPDESMSKVFFKPEQKLQASYASSHGVLEITGYYDALLFNPDRHEAALFEFKSYRRSDLTVPLSQGLIYAWLIWRKTGVLPAVHVIHLGEGGDDGLNSFSSKDVQKMTERLPGLFDTALDVLTGKFIPAASNKGLCSACPFTDCEGDWAKGTVIKESS